MSRLKASIPTNLIACLMAYLPGCANQPARADNYDLLSVAGGVTRTRLSFATLTVSGTDPDTLKDPADLRFAISA